MKQTARIISTYSADVFGVCSALYELGGMTVMHDASGCNGTYSTHDEPRWYDMESMVYISALTEMEAVMGDDEKLVNDIAAAAADLHPRFIAIAGTPIPAMTGFDFEGAAALIEQRTGIPAFGFATTGMNTYVRGASMALEAWARRFVRRDPQGGTGVARSWDTEGPAANILGVTPIDFSTNGTDASLRRFVEKAGFCVGSVWAMGSDPREMEKAGEAKVNLVVSAAGLGAAAALREMFGTPYVICFPCGEKMQNAAAARLQEAAQKSTVSVCRSSLSGGKEGDVPPVAVIGEGVTSLGIASAIEMETGLRTSVLCATECGSGILRDTDAVTPDEDDIIPQLKGRSVIIADPLYRPICPAEAKFISLPSEAFSGRMFRSEIPDLVPDLGYITEKL